MANHYGQLCYTYLIGWKDLDRWYYGRRTANRLPPENDFWDEYDTSSKYVKEQIRLYDDPDIKKIHKKFESVDECKIFEEKFIDRVNAVKSDRWLNKGNAGRNFDTTGRPLSEKHKAAISRHFKGKPLSKDRNPRQGNIGVWWRTHSMTDEQKKKISDRMKGVIQTPEQRLKNSLANRGKIVSEETKIKLRKPKPPGFGARMSQRQKGIKHPSSNCFVCGIKSSLANLSRWHNNNCKMKSVHDCS